ncbi:dual specificity protein phosphatase 26 isoform X6 [Ctenopharyngodon idella]|uniref:dual specificity protein phosphatase 26 isoform X6 n=1 Tax=Ctenopharyngodon idella TaxID=7959 RepID=UPI00223267D4|nr:dual specificity protein phosphatase 26 isoform X6 [Ctenopharyngodon idella]
MTVHVHHQRARALDTRTALLLHYNSLLLKYTGRPGNQRIPLRICVQSKTSSHIYKLDWRLVQMAFMSRLSRSRSNSRSPSRKDSEKGCPVLTVSELERLLYTGKTACNHADEVWPRLYIGDQEIASNRKELIKLGITHILNCAQSKWRGGAEHYAGMNITYHGIEAHDSPSFDMSVNFYPASEFIHRALSTGGTVLVHCAVGVSRSATLVLAYLMIRQNMTLVEAIKTVKDHRGVTPNRGFLRQLSGLDSVLRASRNAT